MNRRIIILSYNSSIPSVKLRGLTEFLKPYGYWHYIGSTWLIPTQETAAEFYEKVRHYFTKEDDIIVMSVDMADYQGWLPQKAHDWINENILR